MMKLMMINLTLMSLKTHKMITLLMMLTMLKLTSMNSEKFFCFTSMTMGMDKLSQPLMILTIIISMMMISTMKSKSIMIMNIMMTIMLMMMFMSMKMVSFYIMFELSLVPMMIMILGWGYQPERMMAGMYLLFYTMTASLPLLLTILYMYKKTNSDLFMTKYELMSSNLMSVSISMAFLVKMPMFMLHFWLPKAHVQAPIFGSMILAGIMLKIGGLGIMRFSVMLENSFMKMNPIWFALSISGAIYISLICMVQSDMKSMIAYSSISHMSMCLLSMLTMTKTGFIGSMIMMISHGLCSSGMFFLSNMNYERTKSRSMFINKGMMKFLPSNTLIWFIFSCLNMGCPPSINFFSEITIMMSMMMYWKMSFLYIIILSFFVSYYSFFMFSYTQHGQFSTNYSLSNVKLKEYNIMNMHLYPMILLTMKMEMFI